MRRFLTVAAVVLACGSCAGGGPGISGDLRNVGSVTVTFKVAPAPVKVGQAVRLTFRLVNNAGREEQLTFPTGQRYDFWATRDDREVWRWSTGRVFVQQITHQSIAAQSVISFAESWTPDRAGTYVLHGELTAERYRNDLRGELLVE